MAESLRPLDFAFVASERPGLAMHVGGFGVLDVTSRPEGPIRIEEIRQRVRSRLRRLPRFRQRVRVAPGGIWRPEWVQAERFSLAPHLDVQKLPPRATWHDVLELVARIHVTPLPPDQPLWHITLIDGLPGGAQGLLTKTHHAMTDGIAGVEVAEALFDEPEPERARGREHSPGNGSPHLGFFDSGQHGRITGLLQAALGVGTYLAGGPIAVSGPFNGPVGPDRRVTTAELPVERLQQIKHRVGGSVDDIFLAAVAIALGRMLRRCDIDTEGLRLRAMVPVSTRGRAIGLGNRVTATFVDLPVDLPPLACLHDVAAAKALRRTWREPLGLLTAVEATRLLPIPLATLTARTVSNLPFANVIVSDIPGPARQLSMLGAPMVAVYPLMPLGGSIGLAIAAVSIGGTMGIGITTDPVLVPGGAVLADEVVGAFESLQEVAAARAR